MLCGILLCVYVCVVLNRQKISNMQFESINDMLLCNVS